MRVLSRSIVVSVVLMIGMLVGAPTRADDYLRPGAEAGFTTLDPFDYKFLVRDGETVKKVVSFTTTQARIFTSFQPADTNPDTAPLFVMLNGGPGAATTANLFANNTAPYTLNLQAVNSDPAGFKANPSSWTAMGNLLYIDPPQTGFSYNISKRVFQGTLHTASMVELWDEYWDRGNFNPFIDADQVLRVLLGFLDSHPQYRDAPVVFVAESYGGVRVSLMLNMLLFSDSYDDGGSAFFRDPDLANAVRRHFGTTEAPAPVEVAAQFSRQVLIQPQLSSYQSPVQGRMYWDEKPPTVIDWIAEDAGDAGGYTRSEWFCRTHKPFQTDKNVCTIMEYVPSWDRDRYDYAQPKNYSDLQDDYVNRAMRRIPVLTAMLGVDPDSIPELKPAARKYAYHTMGWPLFGHDQWPSRDKDTLVGKFGTLRSPDAYYLSWNQDVYLASTINLHSYVREHLPLSPDNDPIFGDIFLANLAYVKTFLTNAARDLVVYSPALPVALSRHTDVVDQVSVALGDHSGTPGRVDVTFKDGTVAHINYPAYPDSGHAVAATAPGDLRDDVESWMSLPTLPLITDPQRGTAYWSIPPGVRKSLRQARIGMEPIKPARARGSVVSLPATLSTTSVIGSRGGMQLTHRGARLNLTRLAVDLSRERATARLVTRGKTKYVALEVERGAGEDAALQLAPGQSKRLNKALGQKVFSPRSPLGDVRFTAGS